MGNKIITGILWLLGVSVVSLILGVSWWAHTHSRSYEAAHKVQYRG